MGGLFIKRLNALSAFSFRSLDCALVGHWVGGLVVER
jgi:hypothetical protein